MSALHTPGPLIACEAPWDDSEYKTEVMVPGRAGQFGTSVATCHHNWREAGAGERKISWAEAQANALLYAAAPDLLKALEEFLPPPLCGEGWNLPDDEPVEITITFGQLKRAREVLAKARGVEA